MTDWGSVALNGVSVVTTIKTAERTFLGIFDATAQTAVAYTSVKYIFKQNPLIGVAQFLIGGVALATSTAVLGDDYQKGKLKIRATDRLRYAAEISTILGDFFVVIGGIALLADTDRSKALYKALGIAGNVLAVGGIVAQIGLNNNNSTAANALTTACTNSITVFQAALSAFSSGLSSDPLSSQWSPVLSGVSSMLTSMAGALNSTTDADFSSNVTASYNAINGLEANYFSLYNAAVGSNSAVTSATVQQQDEASAFLASSYQQSGYYVAQTGDTAQSIVSLISNGGISANTIDTATLMRINAVFGVTTIASGTMVHVPVVTGNTGDLSSFSSPSKTYIFDVVNNALYAVGSSVDGHDRGALIIDRADSGGNYAIFDAGTYRSVTLQPNGAINVVLTTSSGLVLGTLSLPISGAASFTYPDGAVFALPTETNVHLTVPTTVTAPIDILRGYFQQLGTSITGSLLNTFHHSSLDPAPSTTPTVTSVVTKVDDTHANVTYSSTGDGATIAGQTTATITNSSGQQVQAAATNILNASGDISHDTLSGIQVLAPTAFSTVSLTAAELSGFTTIQSSGSFTINAATAGTYSLSGKTVTGTIKMVATDLIGTTLIGNNQNNETLVASLLGTDTLTGGNGSGDVFYAGGGVDTIAGGTGNDTFIVGSSTSPSALAAGTVINGGAGTDTLRAYGDISKATISNIETIDNGGAFTTTLSLAQFGSVGTFGGGIILNAANAGTYSLAGKTITNSLGITLAATSTAGTTLIAGSSGLTNVLKASAVGNDTLQAATNGTTIMYAGGGIDTLIGGAGNNVYFATNGLLVGSSVQGSGSNNILNINGDLTNVTVTGVQSLATDNITLTNAQFNAFGSISSITSSTSGAIYGTTGGTYDLSSKATSGSSNLTIYAASSAGTTLIANANANTALYASAYGNDTLKANAVGSTLVSGGGVDTLIGSTGNDTFIVNNGTAGTTLTGGGGSDTLVATGNINQLNISGVQSLKIESSGTSLTASQLSGFSTIINDYGTSTIPTGTAPIYLIGYGAGTYSLVGKTVTSNIILSSYYSDSGAYTLIADNVDNRILAGGAGVTTLIAGSGNGCNLDAGSGDTTLTGGIGGDYFHVGAGNATMQGNGGNNYFGFDSINSANTYSINNYHTDSGQSNVSFSTVASTNASVAISGSNLVLTAGGAPVTIQNYFAGSAYQVASIQFSDGASWSYQDVLSKILNSWSGVHFAFGANVIKTVSVSGTALTLTINSVATGFTETITWTPGNKAYLNLTNNTTNQTFTTSLSTLTSGQTVTVTGSSVAVASSTGQALFTTQVNTDGSQNDISYDAPGGTENNNVYMYSPTGLLTEIQYNNNNGTAVYNFFNTAGTQVAQQLVNANGTGQVTAYSKTVSYVNGSAPTVTVGANGNVTVVVPHSGASDTFVLSSSSMVSTIAGHTLTNTTPNLSAAVDASGNVIMTSGSTFTIAADGSTDTFVIGQDTIKIAASAVTSILLDGAGAYNFALTSAAPGYGETLTWNPNTGKAILIVTNLSTGTSFSSSLGYINPTDVLTVNATGSLLSNAYASGQLKNATQVNADGSQNDINYDAPGGNEHDNVYKYSAAGVLTEIQYNNNNGSFVHNFFNTSGTQTGQTIYNADGILHSNNSNITAETTTGMTKLDVTGSTFVTAAELTGFTTLTNSTGGADTIYATSAGAYSIASKTLTGIFNLSAAQTTANVTLTGNNQAGETLTGGAGTDTLVAGTGNTTLNGGAGYTAYQFGAAFGQDTINNAFAGNTVAKGEIDFTSASVTDEKLWFLRSGNNLLVDLLGTSSQITVSNWFGANVGADVQTFNAGGLKLDSQVAQLVAAMATYSTAHSTFNPATATVMPTDTTLQSAITTAWHA